MSIRSRHSTYLLIGLAYLGFIGLGLPDGLLGVAWPSMRVSFRLPIDALGILLALFTVGYLLASVNSGALLTHLGIGNVLVLSGLATAIGLVGYALAPYWWMLIGLAGMSGFGAGAIDAGLNTYVAMQHSPRTLNWLHACFGVGATIGPLVMTTTLASGASWRWGYAVAGVAHASLAIGFILTRKAWPVTNANANAEAAAPPTASIWSTLRLPGIWLSIIIFGIYSGVEVTAGQWSYTLLTEGRALPDAIAGSWISVYWGSLTVGRFVFGAIAARALVASLLHASFIGVIIGALLFWLNLSPWLDFAGLVVMGLALAPIFPSLIAITPGQLGAAHAANGVGFQISAAVIGGALAPALVGVLANDLGLEFISLALLIGAVLLLGFYRLLRAYAAHA